MRQFLTSFILVSAAFSSLTCARAQDLSPDVIKSMQSRIGVARDRLAQEFEKASDAGVEGRFAERLPASYLFAPRDTELSVVPLANSNDVSSLAVGPLLRVRGSYDPKAGLLTVKSYELAIATPKEDPEERQQPKQKARAANRELVSELNRGIQRGAMSTVERSLDGGSAIAAKTLVGINQIVTSYQAAVKACADSTATCKAGEIDEIVKSWQVLRSGALQPIFNDRAEDKAIYERLDNYDPWRYAQVSRDALAVVALGEPNINATKARCSGVLIAQDLVLTAAHCFSGDAAAGIAPAAPADLSVWFDFAQHPDGSVGPKRLRALEAEPVAPPSARWPEIMNKQFGPQLYDYAIVRLKKKENQPPAFIETNEPLIPNSAEPRCLKQKSPNRNDSIYVIGYPLGEHARVHASARVYLPYRVMETQMWQLRLDVHADLVGDLDLKKHLAEFDASYVPGVPHPIFGAVRFLYDVRDEAQPRLGIVADVFKGNSGGPVFDHVGDQCVVGILNGGMPDAGRRLNASWVQHERVLPIEAILADLAKNPATAPLLLNGTLVLK